VTAPIESMQVVHAGTPPSAPFDRIDTYRRAAGNSMVDPRVERHDHVRRGGDDLSVIRDWTWPVQR